MAGLYSNELLIKLLGRHDPYPELFSCYRELLPRLVCETTLEPALRGFELRLLASIGYGINLDQDVKSSEPIVSGLTYGYRPFMGFFEVDPMNPSREAILLFNGMSLVALREGRLDEKGVLQDAKRLLRYAISVQLGGKILYTRQSVPTF